MKTLMSTHQEGTIIYISDPLGYVKETRSATEEELIIYSKEIEKSLELSKQGKFNAVTIEE